MQFKEIKILLDEDRLYMLARIKDEWINNIDNWDPNYNLEISESALIQKAIDLAYKQLFEEK